MCYIYSIKKYNYMKDILSFIIAVSGFIICLIGVIDILTLDSNIVWAAHTSHTKNVIVDIMCIITGTYVVKSKVLE